MGLADSVLGLEGGLLGRAAGERLVCAVTSGLSNCSGAGILGGS